MFGLKEKDYQIVSYKIHEFCFLVPFCHVSLVRLLGDRICLRYIVREAIYDYRLLIVSHPYVVYYIKLSVWCLERHYGGTQYRKRMTSGSLNIFGNMMPRRIFEPKR
jgi:hypothetical protein